MTDARLSTRQQKLLDEWLPGHRVIQDHSWGLVETIVLELVHADQRYIAKAGGPEDGHIPRELRAHRSWLEPLTRIGRAPVLVEADLEARLLLTRYLPGRLVQHSTSEVEPDTYRQAGDLLARLHGQLAVPDHDYERRENDRVLARLASEHRIAPNYVRRLRAEVESWPTPATALVPTHGDWQPRNWLVHDGVVSIIDFGRADLRPAMTDLARLAVQQLREAPALEAAFVQGYGADPREPAAWRRIQVREAIGTAVWAYQVGDQPYEQQGHRMIRDVLASADPPP